MNWLAKILQGTVEYQHLGINPDTISAIATIIFSVLTAWGFWKQNQKIWRARSGKSISAMLFSAYPFFFLSSILYGITLKSIAVVADALPIVFSIPILIGLWCFKKWGRAEKIALGVFLVALLPMVLLRDKSIFFIVFHAGIAVTLVKQAREIWLDGRGEVAFSYILTALASAIFWVIYSFSIRDLTLEVITTTFCGLFVLILLLWISAPKGKRQVAARS